MVNLMILCALVLLICITSTKILYRFGVPILLIFIVLGMLFGSDGIVGIYFDNYQLASSICSIALIFIMFYGGFGTNWNMAKPVAVQSILMSSLGVVITAGLTGLFCSLCNICYNLWYSYKLLYFPYNILHGFILSSSARYSYT